MEYYNISLRLHPGMELLYYKIHLCVFNLCQPVSKVVALIYKSTSSV